MGELGELDGQGSKIYPLKLSVPLSTLTIEMELPIDVLSHVTASFFFGVCLSHSHCLCPLCSSPPPGKLAQKTGAQKAAKRSRQLLSTPNACAAGYPPTPC